MGLSSKLSAAEQAKAFGDAWERLPAPRPQLSLEILDEKTGKQMFFNLGPHPPRLWPEDTELLHKLWLRLTSMGLGHKLHHRDVVRVALRRLEEALESDGARKVLEEMKQEASEDKQRKSDQNQGPSLE